MKVSIDENVKGRAKARARVCISTLSRFNDDLDNGSEFLISEDIEDLKGSLTKMLDYIYLVEKNMKKEED